jgi:hypothetical protein
MKKNNRFTIEDIEQLQAKGLLPNLNNNALIMENPPPPPGKDKNNTKATKAKDAPRDAVLMGSVVRTVDANVSKTFLVGIDPDVERCGFAIKDKETDIIIEVKALHFFDVINRINKLKQEGQVIVYVDAGWLHSKSNWHEAQGKRAEKIAKNVGNCHQVGKLLCEYFRRKGLKYYAIKPVTSKIDGKAFDRLKVWKGRTNQDMRDAVGLILGR